MAIQIKTAGVKPATQPKTYYLLFLVNHTNKEFMLRVEDTPGTGLHSIACFARDGVLRTRNPGSLPARFLARYSWVVANCKQLEQSVIACVQAQDSKSARAQIKKHRQNLVKSLQAMGYKSHT